MEKAVQMASYYPAKVLGIDKNVGLLEPGYVANLVAYDDNWQVQRVMMGGIWTYER
jgi:N-acetylgalactosamine-6-phosphate deacetylase